MSKYLTRDMKQIRTKLSNPHSIKNYDEIITNFKTDKFGYKI